MIHKEDLKQIRNRGIDLAQVTKQLEDFSNGFPYLKIKCAATPKRGIVVLGESDISEVCRTWEEYQSSGHKIVKFVPASGAASRMFKDLFAFLNGNNDVPTTDFEKYFFANIHNFAFYTKLSQQCMISEGQTVDTLIANGMFKTVVSILLENKGLDYGGLPKGLLLFHTYNGNPRTPMEEHLVEAALYASCNGDAHVHFTVSHEHVSLFKKKLREVKDTYESLYNTSFEVTFSEQKPSTDTIAVNPDNTPFRNSDGTLLFRPAGHGALIENLNELDADIIFIKNIDNVVPDRLKDITVKWKMVLAGKLVELQKRTFSYLHKLDAGTYSNDDINEMIDFLQHDLCCYKPDIELLEGKDRISYLYHKLNRPMRVCGMVRNVGEPGGGPFLVFNKDNSISLQILESSQIDKHNKAYVKMFTEGTHFNPVDLVCAVKDYRGRPFDLAMYVDKSTGFISSKSKDGRTLKALELPGLWNGAMSDWNTVFVEIPLDTFNPVKTVNDLLREQHQ